jgi:hypothetical protein
MQETVTAMRKSVIESSHSRSKIVTVDVKISFSVRGQMGLFVSALKLAIGKGTSEIDRARA